VGETFNSKPPGPIIMIGRSERNMERQLNHIYYTLLWQVLGFAVPFTSLSKACKNAGPKPFC
jgi:hypothetical protein